MQPNLGHNPLASVQSYLIYYGPVDDMAFDTLKKVDLVILEPRHITRERVQALREAGTRVVGYLSVMESAMWNEERINQLNEADYLTWDGQRIHFAEWNSYLMDLRQAHYQDVLLRETEEHILAKGMDGLFLDTIGDIEEYVPIGDERDSMVMAYLTFLQKIRRAMPSLFLIQNRGFDLLPLTSPLLQGFLWEDWRGDMVDDEWVRLRLGILDRLQANGLRIFTVNMRMESIHQEVAEQRQFVHLMCPNGYNVLDIP